MINFIKDFSYYVDVKFLIFAITIGLLGGLLSLILGTRVKK